MKTLSPRESGARYGGYGALGRVDAVSGPKSAEIGVTGVRFRAELQSFRWPRPSVLNSLEPRLKKARVELKSGAAGL